MFQNYFGRSWVCGFVLVLSTSLLCGCSRTSQSSPKSSSSPKLGKHAPFRFVVVADSRGDYKKKPPTYATWLSLYKITTRILALHPKPRLVIFNGDMVAKTAYCNEIQAISFWKDIFLKPLQKNGIKVYITPGNHIVDRKCSPIIGYIDLFNAYYGSANPQNGPRKYRGVSFSFTVGDVHFATVTPFTTHRGWDNKNEIRPQHYAQQGKGWEYYVNKANRVWLHQDLRQSKAMYKIFFTHVPLYPIGPHHRDRKGLHAHPKTRDELAKILINSDVDAVIVAHEHKYCRAMISHNNPKDSHLKKGFLQVVVGTAGAPLKKEAGVQVKRTVTTHTVSKKRTTVTEVTTTSKPSHSQAKGKARCAVQSDAPHYLVADVEKDKIQFRVFTANNERIDEFSIRP